MTGIISRRVTQAMAAQLERVNSPGEPGTNGEEIAKILNSYQRQVTDLQNLLQQCQQELADARADIDRLTERLAAKEDAGELSRAALTFHGQPVITVREAAARSGLSGATVTRYCQGGWWKAHQDPTSNRWFIDAEQPLTPKPKQ